MGVPIIGTIIFGGVYWGPPIHGKTPSTIASRLSLPTDLPGIGSRKWGQGEGAVFLRNQS